MTTLTIGPDQFDEFDADPNEAYEVAPMPKTEHGPEGWWTITRNGVPDRHHWDHDKAMQWATDPEHRAKQRSKEVMYHKRGPASDRASR